MSWLLIVLTAGNFTFVKITDTEASCEKMGAFYTQSVDHNASYMCVSAETVQEVME